MDKKFETFTAGFVAGAVASFAAGVLVISVGAPSIPGPVGIVFVGGVAGAAALLGAWLK